MHGVLRGGEILRDEHALAERQTVRLDDDREAVLGFNIGHRRGRVGKDLVARRRDAVFLHQVFREHLAALDDRRVRAGAEGADARRLQRVDHARRERVVRRDKDEVDRVFLRELHDAVDVHRADVDALRVRRDAAVARRAPEPVRLRALLQLADDRVLASAAADYQNVHVLPPVYCGIGALASTAA